MYSIAMIDQFLSEKAPHELSESWDNDGVMVCGDKSKQVKKLLVCLELTENALDYAVKEGFDLVVTHHPYIFKKLSRISGTQYANLEKMMKNGISVLSYHTRLDSADGGVNDALAQRLGLESITSFGGETGNIGRMGELENAVTPYDFALLLIEKLGCDIRCTMSENGSIKKVALVGGAGKDFIFEGFDMGADAFVTSEVPHHIFIEVKEMDKSVYDCGHYYTENPVCEKLAQELCEKFPCLEIHTFDVKCPYTCIL